MTSTRMMKAVRGGSWLIAGCLVVGASHAAKPVTDSDILNDADTTHDVGPSATAR
jgi:hypothetical protein